MGIVAYGYLAVGLIIALGIDQPALRGKSQPFGSRTRQRNGTSIHRRALHEGRKLG